MRLKVLVDQQPMRSSQPSSSFHPRRGGVVAVVVACLIGSLAAPAGAQTRPGGSDTTTSPTLTSPPASVDPRLIPTTAAPTAPATTATTAPPSASAWTIEVPGPPAPPPPPATVSPADIARARQLDQQIVAQANALDALASQYDLAQQKVAATAAQLAQVQAQLATAQAGVSAAHDRVTTSAQALHRVAVDAYVNLGAGAPTGRSAVLATYEQGAAETDAQSAVGKALAQLQQLHRDEVRLRATETAIAAEQQKAYAASQAAQVAAAQSQAAAQAATIQQQQLLGTVSQASGSLAPLVAAAHAAAAQAAFDRFRATGGLDFPAPANLGAPLSAAAAAVQVAMAQVGKPYVWGAAGPSSFDCSGLMLWAWARQGVTLPRVAAEQRVWATPVPISQLAPGDLVFFGNPAHHVGMYVGAGLMVDAPHSGANVGVVPIWWNDLAGFGRVHG